MATFKEEFAKKRKELGAGKTFTWNGKSYSTDYAEEKKSAKGTKPKAKPAGLNPQSGAAQSGTAGKVKPKTKPSGFKDKFNDPDSGYNYQHVPGKGRDSSKAVSSLSGASRSVAGKVPPKMSMIDKAKADAKAAREKSRAANKPKVIAITKTTTKPTANKPFQKLRDILSGGGFSKYKG